MHTFVIDVASRERRTRVVAFGLRFAAALKSLAAFVHLKRRFELLASEKSDTD